jgi:hypothetical protein
MMSTSSVNHRMLVPAASALGTLGAAISAARRLDFRKRGSRFFVLGDAVMGEFSYQHLPEEAPNTIKSTWAIRI